MSRSLNDLDYRVRSTVFEFLARCAEAGIPIIIVDTLRTPEEQAANIAKGVSWTTNSKHLPQAETKKSLAIDVAPFDVYQLHGPDKLKWDGSDPVWQRIGIIGEKCGLKWGGRFKPPAKPDLGHFEYYPLAQRVRDTPEVVV